MNKITVMLVDDHPIFRQGIRRVIERDSDMEVIMESADGAEALRIARQLLPNVLIVDIKLPNLNGLEVIKLLTTTNPHVATIAITGHHDDEQHFRAIRAGARAYYPKDVTSLNLLEAIRMVSKGNYIIGEAVLTLSQVNRWLHQQYHDIGYLDGTPNQQFEALSPRELELIQQVAKGYSNQQIASELGISQQTVKNHLRRIQSKLQIHDRTLAALYAVRRGWIEL